jgi:hypothetical protein
MNQPTPLLPVNRPGGIVRLADAVRLGACLALLLVLASAPDARAQANANPPGKLTYQGFLTDVNGTPLGNAQPINTNIIFRIHTASSGGTLRWAEQQTVTIDKGHFSVLLGEGAPNASEPFTNNLSGIFGGSDASERYMEITVGSTIIAPRMQFLPAPYAMLSASARQLVDATGNPVISSTGLNISGAATATSFSGSGASLTSLNANNVNAGTLADGRLSTNVAMRNATNTFSSEQTINGILSFPNGHTIRAKNAAGTYETFIHPRWTDNATYMNFGSAGFHLRTSSGTATRLFVNDEGNVGIGTISPYSRLNVVGTGGEAQGIQLDNREIKFRGDGDTHWSFFANRLSGKFTIETTSGTAGNGTGGTVIMTVNNNGRIGIGTTTPQVPLHVAGNRSYTGIQNNSSGWKNVQDDVFGVWLGVNGGNYNPDGGSGLEGDSANIGYGSLAAIFDGGIVVKQRVWVGNSLNYSSDRRAKEVLGHSDGTKDLDTLLKLQVTDYHWIDRTKDQHQTHKKLIAQEVEAVFPQAVSIAPQPETIPSVYEMATAVAHDAASGTLRITTKKEHGFKVGDKVDLYTDDTPYREIAVKSVATPREFTVACEKPAKKVFVYGKQVKDFRTVDYDAVAMLNVSATQELARRLESKDAEITSLKKQLAELGAKAQAGKDRLASLEKLVHGLVAAKAPANKQTGEE